MSLTSDRPRPSGPAAKPRAAVIRTDIQGLRAIAVSLVLVYHLFPTRLTGGFVGVDVFFVISGFLITSHLLAHPPSDARDLGTFWSRRIRRLLPASLLVLAVTLVATRLVAPETQWANTAKQTRAAALYVVNWVLASDSVDYLAAENAPTPVQHFWSLSVEEQFYFVWPVVILLLVLLAGRLQRAARPIVVGGLALVVLTSLAYSIQTTASEPASAYFITPTRMYELGVGGLVAAWLSSRAFGRSRDSEAAPIGPGARTSLAWIGLFAIAYAAVTYTGGTPFPGWEALVPVLGTAAVIAANPVGGPGSPGPLLALRPVQFLGDISYSVYLWHWPLIVLVPFVSGGQLGILDKLVIVVVSLGLAAATKTYVEDRFRTPGWGRPLRKPYLLAAAGMTVVVVMSLLLSVEVNHREDVAQEQLSAALAGDDPCLGAAALAAIGGDCVVATKSGPVLPAPAEAAKDKSDAYADVSGGKDCWSYLPDFPTKTCTFGERRGSVSVALVGNSHAGQWLPALQEIAKQRGWRITTYLASRCAMADVPQQFATSAQSDSCLAWGRHTAETVASKKYDVVLLTNRISAPAEGKTFAESRDDYEKGYESVLRTWNDAGTSVVALHDTPYPGSTGGSIPDCVATHEDDLAACAGRRKEWVPDDPVMGAALAIDSPRVSSADLTDYICTPSTCPAVVGGVVTYFDKSHLTATYARTLGPFLSEPLMRSLGS